MLTVLLAFGLFGLCMLAMSIGVLLRDRALRGSCGGGDVHGPEGDVLSCGACPKKEAEVCPSDDPLVEIAQLGYPGTRHH